jgi:cytochrome P450
VKSLGGEGQHRQHDRVAEGVGERQQPEQEDQTRAGLSGLDSRLSARPAARDKRRAMRRAAWHELRIYAASHPFALAFSELVRRLGPVVRLPALGAIINDPELARAILEDERGFSKTGPGSMGVVITQVMGEYALFNMHGQPHHELRAQLSDLFSRTYLDRLDAAVVQPAVDALRVKLSAGERVDLVGFVHLLTGSLMCHMLGIDANDERTALTMWQLGEELVSILRLSTRQLNARQVRDRQLVFERLVAYVRHAYDGGARADSLIQRLGVLGLPFEQIKGVTAALFLAGTQTISTALPRLVALLVDSGEIDRLRDHRALLAPAIDEGLRLTVPTPVMLRSTEVDTVVCGHRFRRGSRVMIHTYNLLKHPAWFPRPRQFDIDRLVDRRARNLWFGAGAHFCIGYTLAHRQLREVITGLLDLPRPLRIVERGYARGVFIPAYSRLDVELLP